MTQMELKQFIDPEFPPLEKSLYDVSQNEATYPYE